MPIFISYRRNSTEDIAGRIDDWLRAHFGRNAVVRDVDSIPVGVPFQEHLRTAIGACDLVIALIGPDYFDHRIHEPNDFVRFELEVALEQGIRIAPVLVAGAAIPLRSSLPASLAALPDLQFMPVRSGAEFRDSMQRLIRSLKRSRRRSVPGWLAPVMLALFGGTAGALLAILFNKPALEQAPTQPSAVSPATSTLPKTAPVESLGPDDGPARLRSTLEALNPFVRVGELKVQGAQVSHHEYATYLAKLAPEERRKAEPKRSNEGAESLPVAWTTFEQASRYCATLGSRLPKAAEWKSTIGGLGASRSPGDLPQEWTSEVSDGLVQVVGAKLPAPYYKSIEGASETGTPAERISSGDIGFRCVR